MHCIWHCIFCVIRLSCRFISIPNIKLLHTIRRVKRYIKRIINLILHYHKFSIVLEGYNDTDRNTLSGDSKETRSYIFNMVGGVASWMFWRKKKILAQSIMQSDLIALQTSNEEAWRLRLLLTKVPLWGNLMSCTLLHYNNFITIAKTENCYYYDKRRQICGKHATLKSFSPKKMVRMNSVRTDENLVDHLTKWLSRKKVKNTFNMIRLFPLHQWVIHYANPK